MIYIFRDWPLLPFNVIHTKFTPIEQLYYKIIDPGAYMVWLARAPFDWRDHK